jgi:hypothetical protein
MSFKKDFRDMMSSDGKISSKRVVTLVAFLLVATAFVANLGWAIVMDANVLTGMINVVFAGLGVTVGEHLLRKRNGGENPDGIDSYDDYHPHDNHGGSSPDINVHVHNELGDN